MYGCAHPSPPSPKKRIKMDKISDEGLRELLEKANSATPGEWKYTPGDSWCAYPHVSFGDSHYLFEDHFDDECAQKPHSDCKCGFPSSESNAAFIAALNPQTAKALITELLELRETIHWIKKLNLLNQKDAPTEFEKIFQEKWKDLLL